MMPVVDTVDYRRGVPVVDVSLAPIPQARRRWLRKLSRLGVVTLLRNRRELDCWSRFPVFQAKDVTAPHQALRAVIQKPERS